MSWPLWSGLGRVGLALSWRAPRPSSSTDRRGAPRAVSGHMLGSIYLMRIDWLQRATRKFADALRVYSPSARMDRGRPGAEEDFENLEDVDSGVDKYWDRMKEVRCPGHGWEPRDQPLTVRARLGLAGSTQCYFIHEP